MTTMTRERDRWTTTKLQQSTNEDYILKIIKKYDKREREREKRWDNDNDKRE